MSKQAFGLSVQSAGRVAVILQPPTDTVKGVVFVMKEEKCWKLELNDTVVTPHRTLLNIPESVPKGETPPSATIANYTFLNGPVKEAVGKGCFDVMFEDEPTLALRYSICGAEYSGKFEAFIQCTCLEMVKAMTNELNRVYTDVEFMLKDASDQGLTMELKSEKIDPIQAQKIREMNMLRKHVSAANPLVRAKKVQKGFGSK
jgi:hypothetical protein